MLIPQLTQIDEIESKQPVHNQTFHLDRFESRTPIGGENKMNYQVKIKPPKHPILERKKFAANISGLNQKAELAIPNSIEKILQQTFQD